MNPFKFLYGDRAKLHIVMRTNYTLSMICDEREETRVATMLGF